MSKRLSLLLLVLGLTFNFSFADNAGVIDSCKTVELIKPGKLKSLIKKAELPFIKKLVIKGGTILNEKDYTFISKMPALEVLDLSGIDGNTIPAMPEPNTNIKELIISENMYGYERKFLSPTTGNDYSNHADLLSGMWDIVYSGMAEDWFGKYKEAGFAHIERIQIKGLKLDFSLPFELPSIMYMCYNEGLRGAIMKDGTLLFERKDCSKDFKGHYVIKSHFQVEDGGLREAVYLEGVRGVRIDTIPKNIRYLGDITTSAFEEGDNTLYITDGLNLVGEEIVFNRPVYISRPIHSKAKRITFEKDVEYIGKETFNLPEQRNEDAPFEKFVFKKTPKKIDRKFYYFSGEPYKQVNEIDIPKGAMDLFLGLGFTSDILYEDGLTPLTLDIKLEKPNTILSVLPIDKLSSIDSLTITGFMYETDLEVLKQCKNMRYLNLAKTYITSSPQKKREEDANAAALSGLFSLLGQVADAKYTNGDMTALEHAQIAGFSKLMEDATSVTKAEEECYVPHETLEGMKRLETVILPLRASSIGGHAFYGCTSLKHVVLPPFLSRMGNASFANCYNLEHIDFPATLTDIGMEKRHSMSDYNGACSFENTKIKKFDFSSCTFKSNGFSNTWIFSFSSNIEELRLPKGVSKIDIRGGGGRIYVPSNATSLSSSRFNEYHFESSTPPEMEFKPQNCTIYIPKGSTTAYFAKFGETNKYIEE